MWTRHGARRAAVLLSVPAALCAAGAPTRASDLEELVVTASRMQAPLTVVTDPRAPRQPLPAHDGADYLRTIPGFTVIRKGGTDGDPVFRGMAASRVNMLIDGQQLLGGCGMRMDPPTAYVFPEAYDRIVVVKGPQTVLEGPGNSAATVSFEREPRRFDPAGYEAHASALAAAFGRSDLVGDLYAGTPRVQGRVTATRASSDDYEDGAGRRVHSRYERWSANGALGWTPDERTSLELSGARSDGEAAYADRAMDGIVFDRDNRALAYRRRDPHAPLRGVEAQLYYNYVDHVMDNYSLRSFTPTATMPFPVVQNPDRRTTGGRAEFEWAASGGTTVTAGADLAENQHSLRSTPNQWLRPYESLARVDDAWFRSVGAYGEVHLPVGARGRLVGGLRADAWSARDERETLQAGMLRVPNPTAQEERDTVLPSGFARYERDLAGLPVTAYAGLGHVRRFPDYWELVSAGKESEDSLSAFHTRPERTTQLDAGAVFAGRRLSGSVSVFASDVDDYILIESQYAKGPRRVTVTRNVQARTWGGEADASYALGEGWSLLGTLAWTRGRNVDDARPLAQMPPLEVRSGATYERGRATASALWRLVAAQDRYAVNQGNIVGQDLGRTGGFGVLSLNFGWRPAAGVLVSGGVDNLLDKRYAEHLSRGGAMVAGFEQTTRVNEPGRTLWLKVAGRFE